MSSSNEQDDSNDSKTFIDKLLVEMKSEFNKNNTKTEINDCDNDLNEPPSLKIETDKNFLIGNNTNSNLPSNITKVESEEDTKQDIDSPEIDDDNETKPRIVLTLRPEKTKPIVSNNYGTDKDNSSEEAVSPGRRSLRIKTNSSEEKDKKTEMESGLKRSARRRSKDCTESILQSAIARKEKSYNETARPQRLSRKLKPTAKILANLEMCQKSVSLKNEKTKQNDNKTKNSNIKSPTLERYYYDKLDKSAEKTIKEEQEEHHQPEYKKIKRKLKVKNVKSLMKKPKKTEDNDSDSSSSSPQETEVEKDVLDQDDKTRNSRKSEPDGKSFRRSHRKTSRTQDSDETDPSEPRSGSVAEGQSVSPADPQSSVINNSTRLNNKCLCQYPSQIFLNVSNNAAPADTYCTALDMINERIIGCNNIVSDGVMMLRPSTRIPYIILCEVHKERLIRHNCCPTCGLFCTQGTFTECEAKHQYHRDCSITVGSNTTPLCPHCGVKTPDHDVEIVMKCKNDPVFLPIQKSHYPSAKMSFPNTSNINECNERSITPPLIPSQIFERIKSINSIDMNHEFNISSVADAIKENDVEKVAILLESDEKNLTEPIPNSDGMTVLHLASQHGNLAIVHILLLAGMEQDVFDKEQNTPLMLAILSFQNDVVKYLIKCGADISIKGTDGMSALHLAAKCGNLTACEHLLSSAENRRTFINCVDDGGWTPLVWACEHGHVDVARYLLQTGSDSLLRDVEHNVALHWAAFSGNTKIMEMLFNAGCEVNAINAHGDSPLHIAAREDKYNCVIMLLARGADINLVNTSNETPLDCCIPEPSDCRVAIELNINLQQIIAISTERKKTILTNDISRGKELNPIQCINNIDDAPKPIDFQYIIENCIASDITIDRKITTLHSCVCEDRCTTIDCLCGNNSLKCWYNEEAKLSSDFNYADPPMIFECNTMCSCNAITCYNRVVQHGLTQRFQLFRTINKGWGICTLRLIPRGAYVCEYVGEILSDLDADQREDDSYLFDLDNRDGESYCIDARKYGNLSRFINHSCDPNLLPVRVYIDHQDLRFPRIAFFAKRDIQANEELGFDYGEKFWIIKYKSFTCTCGYASCKYSKISIQTTLDNYRKRLLADEHDV